MSTSPPRTPRLSLRILSSLASLSVGGLLAGCTQTTASAERRALDARDAADLPSPTVPNVEIEMAPGGAAETHKPPTMAAHARLHPALSAYISSVLPELERIPADRRAALDDLVAYVARRRADGAPSRLTFICTHNSRRSHMSQLWAAAAAAFHGVEGVATFSGGTEATAFNPRAVAALRRAGFQISAPPELGDNPRYVVTLGPAAPAVEGFSKIYDAPSNPTREFAAIMTCSEADRSCPSVKGASARIAIPYVDPKVSDGTPEEAATYDARARQIAVEMLYVFSRVAQSAPPAPPAGG